MSGISIIADVKGMNAAADRLVVQADMVNPRLRQFMEGITLDLVGYIKTEKLSGQVLNRRSGRLSRSIHNTVSDNGETVVGIVGTNVVYAAYQEYGFQGTEQVRQHLSHSSAGREYVVRSYSRDVNYPAHSFIRSAYKDKEETYSHAFEDMAKEIFHAE
jgi:phage gpG-like protein